MQNGVSPRPRARPAAQAPAAPSGLTEAGRLAIISAITYQKGESALGPIAGQILLQFVFIAINAIFAATEIALISLNENKLRREADAGDKRAAQMLKIAETPTTFLSTIQIAITLSGFLGAAFGADNFADRITDYFVNTVGVTAIPASTINTLSVVVVTIVISYFTLVLGELVPKRAGDEEV